MTHIRRPLVALLTLFAGALVLDRLGLSGHGDTMASWVYGLALAAATLPLASGGLRRARPWVITSGSLLVYLAMILAVRGRSDSFGEGVFVTSVEAMFLGLSAYLGHRTASALQDVDDTLGVVAFGESPALPLESQRATNEILAEMARSRRHDRPLSVTVVDPRASSVAQAVDRAGEEVQRAIRARYVRGKLARAIADELRRTDLLFEHPDSGRFVILSPETETDGAALVVARARQAAHRLGIDVDAGTASFPDHAFTFEQLVVEAVSRLNAPAPVLRSVTSAMTSDGTGS